MDTSQVAEKLGTTPRLLRQFLRSDYSTFQAVGSGARYDFNDRDFSTLEKRFGEWKGAGKPRPSDSVTKVKRSLSVHSRQRQDIIDAAVWAEEEADRASRNQPPIAEQMEDIRNPRVRARVLRDAAAAEARLMQRLLAAGRHITQLGDRKPA